MDGPGAATVTTEAAEKIDAGLRKALAG